MEYKEDRPKKYVIILFASILLFSISVVSSIGVFKNRSFFFDGYIYNNYIQASLNKYCADVYRLVTGAMDREEAGLFKSQNDGVYYFITNDNTKETFTNIPDGKNYFDFSSQNNIVSLQYINIQAQAVHESNKVRVTVNQEGQQPASTTYTGLSGYVFIDKNTAGLFSNPFQIDIKNGFNLQRILFIESSILIISLLIGIVLLLISLKKAIRHLVMKTDFIPIDVKMGMIVAALALYVYLYGTYSYTIGSFSALTHRVILYNVFVLLTFIILSIFTVLVLKTKQYAEDRLKFYQEWESRLTKKIPSWIIGLVLQSGWYFFILTAVSPGYTVYDHIVVIKNRWAVIVIHNILIFIAFILVGRIQKGKAVYRDEVLSYVQEISNGNLDLNVPVAGNDFYSQIANNINTIKAGYIHALNEQKKSERLKYELVTNISHDLRTPLTSVINYIGLVKKKAPAGDVEKFIEHADMNAKRLNILIEDLFELSKIESGNIQLDISNVDLVLMFKQIGHEYSEKIKQNGLELVLESTSKQIMWHCDGPKIWRVFDNLVNNAVKYSLLGTRIYINIAEQPEKLAVSIKNIASHRMDFEPEELFLRFKRGDEARGSDGSGLGLAIAKSIVELHGGKIAIETEGDMFKVIIQLSRT